QHIVVADPDDNQVRLLCPSLFDLGAFALQNDFEELIQVVASLLLKEKSFPQLGIGNREVVYIIVRSVLSSWSSPQNPSQKRGRNRQFQDASVPVETEAQPGKTRPRDVRLPKRDVHLLGNEGWVTDPLLFLDQGSVGETGRDAVADGHHHQGTFAVLLVLVAGRQLPLAVLGISQIELERVFPNRAIGQVRTEFRAPFPPPPLA